MSNQIAAAQVRAAAVLKGEKMKKTIITIIICAVVALSSICFSGCDIGATLNGWVTQITNAITGKGNDQTGGSQSEEPDDVNTVLAAPTVDCFVEYLGTDLANLDIKFNSANADTYKVHITMNEMQLPTRTTNNDYYILTVRRSQQPDVYKIHVVSSDSTGKYQDSEPSETITVTLFE